MGKIVEFLKLYYLEVTACAAFLSLLSIIIVLINSIRTKKIINRYNKLMHGVDNKNLESTLNFHMDNVEKILADVKDIKLHYNQISSQIENCIQKVEVIRYNAFDDVGSNQSYSIALLDNKNNGVVLTGLFGRNASTTYAKPIIDGTSKYPLTDEEREVIKKAVNRK